MSGKEPNYRVHMQPIFPALRAPTNIVGDEILVVGVVCSAHVQQKSAIFETILPE